jgi:hypothetical protein
VDKVKLHADRPKHDPMSHQLDCPLVQVAALDCMVLGSGGNLGGYVLQLTQQCLGL